MHVWPYVNQSETKIIGAMILEIFFELRESRQTILHLEVKTGWPLSSDLSSLNFLKKRVFKKGFGTSSDLVACDHRFIIIIVFLDKDIQHLISQMQAGLERDILCLNLHNSGGRHWFWIIWLRENMYIENKSEPRTDPWGTPQLKWATVEQAFATRETVLLES